MKSKILLGFFILGLNLGVFAEKVVVLPTPEPHPIICDGCCGHQLIVPAPAPQPQEIYYDNDSFVFYVVETMPSFLGGGISAWLEFVRENIQFPEEELAQGIQGRVLVLFTVELDGSASDIQVVRGLTTNFKEEALRIISLMPKWTPGKQRGIPVRVRFVVPIHFRIDEWLKRQAQNEE